MYKSAHEEFFDFILKSHISDPKLNLNNGVKSETQHDKKKLSEMPIGSLKSEIDENVHTSNKSKRKNRKLNLESSLMLLDDVPKTTNELLKELAQTVKEGQSLQKDVEVLKKVVFDHNSRSNQFCFAQNISGMMGHTHKEFDQYNNSLLSNKYNENIDISGQQECPINRNGPIDCNIKKIVHPNLVHTLQMDTVISQNNFPTGHSSLQQHIKFYLSRILKRIKQAEQIQISIRSVHKQIKSNFVDYIEQEKGVVAKLLNELESLNKIKLIYENDLKEKDAVVVRMNDSINMLNIENKNLNEKCNAVQKEKELFESEVNLRLHNLEKENTDLKNSAKIMENRYEDTKSELKKTKCQSNEIDKFISQLRNMGIIEKIDDSKYLVNSDNKPLNEELLFLKNMLKDQRDRDELLHKNISQLSDENSRLNATYIEIKTSLDKKIRENCILQSILENYKTRIGDLEEKNLSLESEINNWKIKAEAGAEEGKNSKIKISQLESELSSCKNELNTRSIEFNNSLSRLGQAYVELNETKQLLKEKKHELESCNAKIRSINRENKELNDALSSQFHLNRKKDIEIESIKNECKLITSNLENEKLLNGDLRKKILELEVNYTKVENDRFEIHKELNNKCITEMKKKESLEKVSKEYDELKKQLLQKDLQIDELKDKLHETIDRLEQESLNKINSIKNELSEKFRCEIRMIEESKNNISNENESLIEEVIHQKKMIQELIYEKISLNNELNTLKEVEEANKKQFENSIQILSKELSALQELGNSRVVDSQEISNIRKLVRRIGKLDSESCLLDVENNSQHAQLHQIQSTTAPPSNYSTLKTDCDEFNFNTSIFPDKQSDTSITECSNFCRIEASLSAQCEMAYIDIISQTERFKDISNRLKILEGILKANGEKSISEIVVNYFEELDNIGISSRDLFEITNSENKSKIEINNELSNIITEISRAWVIEAEASKHILDHAHRIRNIAAKERMMWIEKGFK